MAELIAVIALVVLALVAVARSVRVVQQSTVGVVQRLGRYQRTLGPGVHLLVPGLDRIRVTVDMKETVQAFAPQPVITQDNVTIGIDMVVYYQVTDAVKATYEVLNVLVAMEQLTITTLRNVVGSMTLEETLTSRDQINSQLRSVLDDATEKWGVRVTRVELKSIDPPRTRGREAVGHPACRGPAPGRDPERGGRPAGKRAAGRGREAGPRAAGRGRGAGAREDLRHRPRGRDRAV
jgi:regulator of protease activity HflC (stomatin/prohibitin superfamily)